METEASRDQAARQERERVLSSSGFSRNERLSRFLRFLVERHLEGKGSELKESVIAVDVFGRKAGYDPKLDAIVRTEAVRLRARLEKYYQAEGSHDPLIIDLPKGGYRPVWPFFVACSHGYGRKPFKIRTSEDLRSPSVGGPPRGECTHDASRRTQLKRRCGGAAEQVAEG